MASGIPRQPLPDGKIYHFNVIYNHARCPMSVTPDTEEALEFTGKVVATLQSLGYVNNYYHERDCLPGRNVFNELFRVVDGSDYTIVVLTSGFVQDCWSRYTQMAAFKKLLEVGRTPRFLPLAVGLEANGVPQELNTEHVLFFSPNWRTEELGWLKLTRVFTENRPVAVVDRDMDLNNVLAIQESNPPDGLRANDVFDGDHHPDDLRLHGLHQHDTRDPNQSAVGSSSATIQGHRNARNHNGDLTHGQVGSEISVGHHVVRQNEETSNAQRNQQAEGVTPSLGQPDLADSERMYEGISIELDRQQVAENPSVNLGQRHSAAAAAAAAAANTVAPSCDLPESSLRYDGGDIETSVVSRLENMRRDLYLPGPKEASGNESWTTNTQVTSAKSQERLVKSSSRDTTVSADDETQHGQRHDADTDQEQTQPKFLEEKVSLSGHLNTSVSTGDETKHGQTHDLYTEHQQQTRPAFLEEEVSLPGHLNTSGDETKLEQTHDPNTEHREQTQPTFLKGHQEETHPNFLEEEVLVPSQRSDEDEESRAERIEEEDAPISESDALSPSEEIRNMKSMLYNVNPSSCDSGIGTVQNGVSSSQDTSPTSPCADSLTMSPSSESTELEDLREPSPGRERGLPDGSARDEQEAVSSSAGSHDSDVTVVDPLLSGNSTWYVSLGSHESDILEPVENTVHTDVRRSEREATAVGETDFLNVSTDEHADDTLQTTSGDVTGDGEDTGNQDVKMNNKQSSAQKYQHEPAEPQYDSSVVKSEVGSVAEVSKTLVEETITFVVSPGRCSPVDMVWEQATQSVSSDKLLTTTGSPKGTDDRTSSLAPPESPLTDAAGTEETKNGSRAVGDTPAENGSSFMKSRLLKFVCHMISRPEDPFYV